MNNMNEDSPCVNKIVASLYTERPKFHLTVDNQPACWGINSDFLDWLAIHLTPGQTTLETGAGLSTVVFLASGCRHTVISPSSFEHEQIRNWCCSHQIPLQQVVFHVGQSQLLLPHLELDELDCVLIDGAHAFPFPFLDWYYTAINLRKGGLCCLDDTHLRSVSILKHFLETEKGRWRKVVELGGTTVFQKETEEMFPARGWQPFLADWEIRRNRRNKLLRSIVAVPFIGPLAHRMYRSFRSCF